MSVTIFHNPRCSKSRATLALLEERGLDPEIVDYLGAPPDKAALKKILGLLNKTPRDIMRKNEDVYRELGLGDGSLTDEELLDAMVAHPILIERPIVLANGRAALGRPPESVLDIL